MVWEVTGQIQQGIMASATGLGVTLGEPGEDISIANEWTERREEMGMEYTCFNQTLNFTKAGNIPSIPLRIPMFLTGNSKI